MRFSVLALLSLALPALSSPHGSYDTSTPIESRSIEEIYAAAKKESGTLQVAWGGDEKSTQVVDSFRAAFPGININLTVDLSKYHDSHTDRYYLSTGRDFYDLAFLQTLHDFPRWEKAGRLLPYKVKQWSEIYDEVKNKDGYFTAGFFYAFGNIIYNEAKLPAGVKIPSNYQDFLKPEWKGKKIVLTYPNDDDAITYLFTLIIEKYGWSWFTSLMAQDVHWVRGSTTPGTILTLPTGPAAISFTTFPTGAAGVKAVEPKDRYMSWPQTGAIFHSTKMPETSKLFVSWILGDSYQKAMAASGISGARKDLAFENPFTKKWTEPLGFGKWMSDREKVEWYKLQFESLVGTAQGLSPLEDGV